MAEHSIYMTTTDAEKLRELIRKEQQSKYRHSPYLKMLLGELNRSIVMDARDIPADVITMNSTAFLIDLETGEEMTFTLVFPENADAVAGKISILAPIGTAMLGYRVGDIFEWDTPGGKRKIRVEKVIFQPEASGDF